MPSPFEWTKLFVENSFISKNQKLIIFVLTLIFGSVSAGVAQQVRLWNSDKEWEATANRIAQALQTDKRDTKTSEPRPQGAPVRTGLTIKQVQTICEKVLKQHEDGRGGLH